MVAALRPLRLSTFQLSVACLTRQAEWAILKPEWDALHALIAGAHPSLGFEWTVAWQEYITARRSASRRDVRVYTVRGPENELRAVVPCISTEVRVGPLPRARSIDVGLASFCTERTPLLLAPSDEAAVMQVLARRFADDAFHLVRWTALLRDREAIAALSIHGTGLRAEDAAALILEMPSSWAVLRSRLSRKMRKTLRTDRRYFRDEGIEPTFHVHVGAQAVRAAVASFVDLHRDNAGANSKETQALLASPSTERFLGRLASSTSALWSMRAYELRVLDKPAAIRFGMLKGDVLHLHLFADAAAWRGYGSLTLLGEYILRHSITQRHARVHLGIGRNPSALRWRPTITHYTSVVVWRSGWWPATLRLAHACRLGGESLLEHVTGRLRQRINA